MICILISIFLLCQLALGQIKDDTANSLPKNVEVLDHLAEKAVLLKGQLDILAAKLAEKYNTISLDLLKVKNPKVRMEFLYVLTEIRAKVESAYRAAGIYYIQREGDRMAEQLSIMKQWGNRYNDNDNLIQGILVNQQKVNTAIPFR